MASREEVVSRAKANIKGYAKELKDILNEGHGFYIKEYTKGEFENIEAELGADEKIDWSGIYILSNKNDEVIYIGKAMWHIHRRAITKEFMKEVEKITIIIPDLFYYNQELAERELIDEYEPKHNKQ